MATKSNKTNLWISLIAIVVGLVFACSSIIPNEYLKLFLVFATLAYGLFGIMKALSSSSNDEEVACNDDKH